MSRRIELPDDVYARVKEAASASGNSVAEVIAARFPASPAPPCTSLHTVEGGKPAANGAGVPALTRPEGEAAQATCDNAGNGLTMADRLAGRIGRLRSGRTDASERASELFVEGLLEKKRTGHL